MNNCFFKEKMSKFCFQLLICEYFLVSFVLNDSKLDIKMNKLNN